MRMILQGLARIGPLNKRRRPVDEFLMQKTVLESQLNTKYKIVKINLTVKFGCKVEFFLKLS